MQGSTEVATASTADLPLEQAASFLRQATSKFLAKSGLAAARLGDVRGEAQQLAEFARSQMDLGSSREGMDLIEASLLLDPGQPELRLDAVEVLSRVLGKDDGYALAVPTTARPAEAAHHRVLPAWLEHLELYLPTPSEVDRQRKHDMTVIFRFATSLDWSGNDMLRDKFLTGTVSKAAGRMEPATLDMLRVQFLKGDVSPLWQDFMAAPGIDGDVL